MENSTENNQPSDNKSNEEDGIPGFDSDLVLSELRSLVDEGIRDMTTPTKDRSSLTSDVNNPHPAEPHLEADDHRDA